MPLIFVGNRKTVLYVVAVMMATKFCKLSCSSPVLARAGLQRDGSDSEERQAGGGFVSGFTHSLLRRLLLSWDRRSVCPEEVADQTSQPARAWCCKIENFVLWLVCSFQALNKSTGKELSSLGMNLPFADDN